MTLSEHSDVDHHHTIQANGLDIYYGDYGQGEPLILIHGGILTSDSWEAYRAAFAEHFRVITPDTRNHGRTTNPTGEMSFGALADDVAALAEALNLHKPLIVGYSDGGQAVLELGMRYPDLAQALVIGGSYVELTEASRIWVRSVLGEPESPKVDFEEFERDNAEWAADLKQTHGAEQWKTLLQNIKPMWNATLNYTADDFAKVVAPTLVLLADRDDFVPVEEACQMYRLLPHAELAMIPNATHTDFIFSPSKIALCRAILFDFLLRHSAVAKGADTTKK